MNPKGYYSILQGICDGKGKFLDIFVGSLSRVHDARLLRKSPLFAERAENMAGYFLLGDTACIAKDFRYFVPTSKRNIGVLTQEDLNNNTQISRGSVIIENTFGRMKCSFRRTRDLQSTSLLTCVKTDMAVCTLHNMRMEERLL